jgi:hypothetical protein
MSDHSEHRPPASPMRRLLRRFLSTLSILCIVLYVIFFASDLIEYFHKKGVKPEPAESSVSFTDSTRDSIQDQLSRLHKVSPMRLLGAYDRALDTTECSWDFWCHDKPPVYEPIDPVMSSLGRPYSTKPPLEAMDAAEAILARNKGVSGSTAPATTLTLPKAIDDSEQGRLRAQANAAISARLRAYPNSLPTNLQSIQGGAITLPIPSPGIQSSPVTAQPAGPADDFPAVTPKVPRLQISNQIGSGGLTHVVHNEDQEEDDTSRVSMTFLSHFVHFGPIFVPTFETIRGTPYALLQMAVAIRKQGAWAAAMYLSCAVIFVVLWFWAVNKSKGGFWIYTTAVFAPLCISFMVMCVQWVAQMALQTCGWAVGLLAIIIAHATALALLVGVRHIVKTPRELVEEFEKLV